VLEVWAGKVPEMVEGQPPRASFRICRPVSGALNDTVEQLRDSLQHIRTSKLPAEVEVVSVRREAPPGMKAVLPAKQMKTEGIHWLGLEVAPIYLDPEGGHSFPILFRAIRRQVYRAMNQAFYAFSHECTTHHPPHFHTLGRRAVVKAVWEVDRQLAEIGTSFDLLRQVTPINAEVAWNRFRRNRYERPPRFLYRPRSVDPGRMKRKLYSIAVDRVEDPTLQRLFLDKQQELDRELTMLADLNQRSFLYGSLQLHGKVEPKLLQLALELMSLPAVKHRQVDQGEQVNAEEFVALAHAELAWYRACNPAFKGGARVSARMYGGMLVSNGELLVGADASFPRGRVDALLQHEVGTHIVTWSNGLSQPLKLLAAGLPRYEEFQEGLAVLSEYLCGGFDPVRLHLLAARVLAVHAMTEGADFLEVFRMLTQEHGITQRNAWLVAMRVFRGGGFAKDAVYLRGLVYVLRHLANEGSFNQCFVGKMGGEHLPVIEELMFRKILHAPPVLPRYLEAEPVQRRLERVRQGLDVKSLLD
jgi:uncharacterized protein (TIGR02421 family)